MYPSDSSVGFGGNPDPERALLDLDAAVSNNGAGPMNGPSTSEAEACDSVSSTNGSSMNGPSTSEAESYNNVSSSDGTWTNGSSTNQPTNYNASTTSGLSLLGYSMNEFLDVGVIDSTTDPFESRQLLNDPCTSNGYSGVEASTTDETMVSPTSEASTSSPETGSPSPSPSPSPPKKRGRKNPGDVPGPAKVFKRANPFRRPPINILKRSGASFLQDGPCSEVAPKLVKCRECRVVPINIKNPSSIFCRFYAFRKLRYTKSGSLAIGGFSDPFNDPTQEDLDLWLPSTTITPKSLDLELAKFLIDQLGDQFCELIQQEKAASNLREPQEDDDEEDQFVAWKRVVQGVREMCDVCDTTLFNYHWACRKCGFGVCIACYRARIQGTVKHTGKEKNTKKDRDEFYWLFCSATRQPHEMENLMLSQTIAGNSLIILGDLVHKMRAVWNIPQDCGCETAKRLNEQCLGIEEDRDSLCYADLVPKMPIIEPVDTQSSEAEKAEDSDEDVEGFGDLAALLQNNTPPKPHNSPTVNSTHQSTSAAQSSKNDRHFELKHYVRRATGSTSIRSRKQARSVDAYTLTMTKEKYPTVPHSWLTYGRLLRLHDPNEEGNQELFRDVWIRGQPVIVSNVADNLNANLWSPEAFLQDFSELKNDLVNCMTGRVLFNQPMKRFWEGFEYVEKRLKDEKGNPMLLKLKDWPPGEDFAQSLPSRFFDLMNSLPLKNYTERDGKLNLASRLPPKFVRPDLGPKMYIAYGSGQHLDKGTTNLHLDTSDAVNLMVHVGVPKDVDNEEDHKMVLAAIEESDVDGATIDRVRDGELPGALWHIYNFNDADKIRDLLNKVALERGTKLEADHDPIHDQNWYLDKTLRARLVNEYDTVGFPMVQFAGDAVFIPAGAPHQVRNLHNCIKIAEDFVSPENVSHCFKLTEEFRELTETHSNHEDKLQIKNIIYHAVKDAVSVLYQNMSDEQKKIAENIGSQSLDETPKLEPPITAEKEVESSITTEKQVEPIIPMDTKEPPEVAKHAKVNPPTPMEANVEPQIVVEENVEPPISME